MAVSLGKIFGLVLTICFWGSWVILLAGVAKVADDCMKDKYLVSSDGITFIGERSTVGDKDCAVTYSYSWWSVWLQFMCQLLALFMLLGLRPFATSFTRTAIVFFIMSTVLLFQIANMGIINAHTAGKAKDAASDAAAKLAASIKRSSRYSDADAERLDAANAAVNLANEVLNATRAIAAGAVLLMIFNFIWLIFHTSDVTALHSHAPGWGRCSCSCCCGSSGAPQPPAVVTGTHIQVPAGMPYTAPGVPDVEQAVKKAAEPQSPATPGQPTPGQHTQ
eukprot:CAMPEP_0202922878 /NCGR_PEP_ID=MMETSP1392-20130828/78155_1 /ASSEMBLY_ACC=CAM_ASM_000868 /TAXON_ID=225041 /ORGANISM="Chlamydomonas chlamydogama, Strain SAG 11-48b" /LENGTH=277 /DNA_ID=CAMNT_0049616531 /DNA_START=206 /DNA_END=1039 /DNA_ORIENTATION=-